MPYFADPGECACHRALDHAILTVPKRIPAAVRKRLAVLIDRAVRPQKGVR
jgi:5'-methylthioadenosine phosphorylase